MLKFLKNTKNGKILKTAVAMVATTATTAGYILVEETRERIEGVLIGVGVVEIGTAIYKKVKKIKEKETEGEEIVKEKDVN